MQHDGHFWTIPSFMRNEILKLFVEKKESNDQLV